MEMRPIDIGLFILSVLSLRYFLFDFYLFDNIRKFLSKETKFLEKVLSCSFCQAFWCNILMIFAYSYSGFAIEWLYAFMSFLISGFLSVTWTVWFKYKNKEN